MEASEMTDSICGKVKSEILYPSEKPQEDNSDSSSNKQNSIFSLSMDEIEGKTGKSFGSMNLDELLNNLWNVEDSSNPTQNERTNDVNIADPINFPIKNSFSIPTPLCNKTLEEVWEEINRNQSPENNPNGNCHGLCQGQPTLGEMTLEDFLVKVGVVQDGFILSLGPKVFDSYRNHCAKFSSTGTCLDPYNGQGPIMGPEFAQPNNGNNFIANGSPMYQVFTPSGTFVGEASNSIGNGKCNGARDMGDPLTKRRTANGPLQLAVERRQRRMIKNRESAARSRARKQAYTAELEIELTQLREENARLRMILAESENKRKKEVVKGKSPTKAKQREEKLKTMRRSISLAW